MVASHPHSDGLKLTPLSSALGVEIEGVDLTATFDTATCEALRAAFRRYRLLLIRQPDVDADSQARFARLFGDIQIREDYDVGPSRDADTQYVSNTRDDGILGLGELNFHCDQLFQPDPLKGLILYAVEVPDTGGDTSFCNTTLAYQAMPESLRRDVADKTCMHLYDFKGDYTDFQDPEKATEGSPFANHPMIYFEPETGEPAIWVNHTTTIRVNELAPEASKRLIADVRSYLQNEEIIYRHQWRAGDLLLWDNRMLQHARSPFDGRQPRTLRRTPLV